MTYHRLHVRTWILATDSASGRTVFELCCIAIAIIAAGVAVLFYSMLLSPTFRPFLGWDLAVYQNAALRWLEGGEFYLPYQLAGPYVLGTTDSLYPPVTLALFVPSLLLPAILWWIVPLSVTAAVVIRHRPAAWAIALIAIAIAMVPSVEIIGSGNPAMWVGAALAVSTLWRPAAVLVFLKPSLAPLALFGIHDRRWWILAGALGLISLALLPMDIDWLQSILNARGERSGLLHSIRDVPFVMIGLVAWAGRRRG